MADKRNEVQEKSPTSKYSSTQQRYGRGPGGPRRGPGGPMVMVIERPKDGKNAFFRLLGFLKPYLWFLGLIVLAVLITAVLDIISPKIQGVAVDKITQGLYSELPILILYVLVIQAVSSLFGWLQHYSMAIISNRVVRDIRREIFAKIQKLPISYFDSHQVGDMMSRMVNDVDNVSRAISMTATNIVSSPACGAGRTRRSDREQSRRMASIAMKSCVEKLSSVWSLIFFMARSRLSSRTMPFNVILTS